MLLFPGACAAQLTLTADTHVTAARSTTNFGTLSNLQVGNGSTALLRFDLGALPTGLTASQVAKATLTIYVNRVFTSGLVSVAPVTSAWSESAVTYGTAPQTGSSIGSVTAAQAGQFVTVDVTSQVQSWLAGTANYGLALTSAAGSLLLDSKENDQTAHAARLDVTVTSTGATGPAGPAGPQGIPGTVGAQGPQGLTGATGTAGPQGLVGATGVAGPQGIQGLPGTNGAVGATGATGPQGPVGLTGATGAQGVQGVTGGAGPQGPVGSTGATGLTGPQGSAGSNGTNGINGTNGSQNWSASLTFPATTSSSTVLYGLPIGASTMSTDFFGNVLPVPQTCSAGQFALIGLNTPSNIAVRISLVSYNREQNQYETPISCTLQTNSTNYRCLSSATWTIYSGNVVTLKADSFSLGEQPANTTIKVTASFVCN